MEDAKPRSRPAKQPHAYIATEFGHADGISTCTQKDVVLACGPTNRNDAYGEVDEVQPKTVTGRTTGAKCAANAPLPVRGWEGSMKPCEGVGTMEGIEHEAVTEEEEAAEYQVGEKKPEESEDKKKEDQEEGCDKKADVEGHIRLREKKEEPEQQNDNTDTVESYANDTEEGKVSVADIAQRMENVAMDATLEERVAVIGHVAKRIINKEAVPENEKYRIAEVLGTKNMIGFQLVAEATNFFRALSMLGELNDKSVIGEFVTEEQRRYGKQLTAEQIALILDTVAKQFNV